MRPRRISSFLSLDTQVVPRWFGYTWRNMARDPLHPGTQGQSQVIQERVRKTPDAQGEEQGDTCRVRTQEVSLTRGGHLRPELGMWGQSEKGFPGRGSLGGHSMLENPGESPQV